MIARALAVCLLLSAVFLTSGCREDVQEEPPKTWPVKGKVVYTGKSLEGGVVEFRPVGEGMRASGDIGPDGSYSLAIIFGSNKVEGAPPGEYKVTVIGPTAADQSVDIFEIPKTYTVQEQNNEFMIDVSKK